MKGATILGIRQAFNLSFDYFSFVYFSSLQLMGLSGAKRAAVVIGAELGHG